MLEGPEALVEATYRRIARDDRHLDVRAMSRRTIADDARLFGAWAMRDDPADTWVWTRAQIDQGALDRATEDDVLAIFTRLASAAV